MMLEVATAKVKHEAQSSCETLAYSNDVTVDTSMSWCGEQRLVFVYSLSPGGTSEGHPHGQGAREHQTALRLPQTEGAPQRRPGATQRPQGKNK